MSLITPYDFANNGGGSSLSIDGAIDVTSSYSGWNSSECKTKINFASLTRYGRISIVTIYAAFTQQFTLGTNVFINVCSCVNNLNGKLLPYSTYVGTRDAIGNGGLNVNGILYPCMAVAVSNSGEIGIRIHPSGSIVVAASDDTTIEAKALFVNRYSE